MYSLCVILKKPKVKIRYNKFECGFYKKDNMILYAKDGLRLYI